MIEANFPCSKCEKQFSTKFSLQRHTRIVHEGLKSFVCQCSKSFGTSDQLRRHKMSKHSYKVPFNCDYSGCGRTFRTKSALSCHKKNTHGIGDFTCPIFGCGRSFQTIKNLKSHLELPHDCQVQDTDKEVSKALKSEIQHLSRMKTKFTERETSEQAYLQEEDEEQSWSKLISEL